MDYELLLFSLRAPHNANNTRRQFLSLSRWTRTVISQGILVSDLPHVIAILEIIRCKITSQLVTNTNENNVDFAAVLANCLEACALPLLEQRAYQGNQNEYIPQFLQQIAQLYTIESIEFKILVTKCLWSIVTTTPKTEMKIETKTKDKNNLELSILLHPITDKAFIQTVITRSGVLQLIVQQFFHTKSQVATMIQNNIKYDYKKLDDLVSIQLTLCLELSKTCTNACLMNKYQICTCAMQLLELLQPSGLINDKKSPDLIELVWNCLDAYNNNFHINTHITNQNSTSNNYSVYKELEDDADDVTTTHSILDLHTSITVLINGLTYLLQHGYRQIDKEMRNNLLVLLTKISFMPDARNTIIDSNALVALIGYGTAGEAGQNWCISQGGPTVVTRNFVSTSDIDIEFKRLVWNCISNILRANDNKAYSIITSSPFISTLRMYLDQDSNDNVNSNNKSMIQQIQVREDEVSSTSMLTTQEMGTLGAVGTCTSTSTDMKAFFACLSRTQLRELQVVASSIISEHAQYLPSAFSANNGIYRTLVLLDAYGDSKINEHKALLFHSLLALLHVCTYSQEARNNVLNANGLDKLQRQITSMNESVRALACRLIALLCIDDDNNSKNFSDSSGIRQLISSITLYTNVRDPIIGHKCKRLPNAHHDISSSTDDRHNSDINITMVAILDCIRSTVVRKTLTEQMFAMHEGIDTLLSLLEVVSFPLQTIILRILSDLSENISLAPFFKSWRSAKTMRYTAQLLVHAWLDEEVRLCGVLENGVLQNLRDPLGSNIWASVAEASKDSGGNSEEVSSGFVSKLARTVLKERSEGVLPEEYRDELQMNDLRTILANILTQLYAEDPLFVVEEEELNEEYLEATRVTLESENGLSFSSSNDMNVSTSIDNTSNPVLKKRVVYPYGLTASDMQVIVLSWCYRVLKEGQLYDRMHQELVDEHVELVQGDSHMIGSILDNYFNVTRSLQYEQMRLLGRKIRLQEDANDSFIGKIIAQKKSQIKAEWIKKNAKSKNAKRSAD